jgi:predicted RNA-binding protein with PIN domain
MQEHLMVDGNNALHAIPELANELSRDRNQARESLLRLLEPLQSGENVMLTVVFDGRGGRSSIAKHRNIEEFTVIYSSSVQGADGVIERMLMAAKSPERIVVVTNDGLIRNCAYESGASAMRVEELIKRLDRTIDQTAQRIRNRSTRKGDTQSKFENKIQIPKQKPEK